MGSGPSNAETRVLQAMAMPPLAADEPEFAELTDELSQLVRAVFQAKSAAASMAVPGASRSGLEASLVSLIEPGDRVLVGVYGHFGELLCTLAARHGARVERVEAEWGSPVDADEVARRVREAPPKLVAIVHADTSTGILQPIAPIGAACRDTDTLLLVDAVLSLGGCEVCVDDWNIDVAVGGLQKCLGGPPGLSLVTYSARVDAAMQSRATPAESAYLDLTRVAHAIDASSSMLMAAREALRLAMEEGLAQRWARHARASQLLRAGLQAMGLELFGASAYSAPMITLVKVPEGLDEPGVRAQLLQEHGIEIMAAFGPLRGRVWRIGTLGTNASLESVLAVLSGLEAVLASRGLRVQRGAAVDAALGHVAGGATGT